MNELDKQCTSTSLQFTSPLIKHTAACDYTTCSPKSLDHIPAVSKLKRTRLDMATAKETVTNNTEKSHKNNLHTIMASYERQYKGLKCLSGWTERTIKHCETERDSRHLNMQ